MIDCPRWRPTWLTAVEVIVTYTDAAALAAKTATTTIPIVFINGGTRSEPASCRASTGRRERHRASFFGVDLAPKQLALLHEVVPKAAVVALLVDENVPDAVTGVSAVQEAARILGLQLVVLKARTASDIDTAFATLVRERGRCTRRRTGALLTNRRKQIVALAARHALPTIYPFREFSADGGLISYGNNVPDTFRQGGVYAGRISQGRQACQSAGHSVYQVRMRDQPQDRESNGIEIPPNVSARADEVIE